MPTETDQPPAGRWKAAHAIAVTSDHAAWRAALPEAEEISRRAAAAALSAAGPAGLAVEVSILLTGDERVADLNRKYRGRAGPTNVLSFPSGELSRAAPRDGRGDRPVLLGDVAVAFETAAAEARSWNQSLSDHLAHLIVHGVLHLLGYDHQDDAAAEAMETLEISALETVGFANPYQEPHATRG